MDLTGDKGGWCGGMGPAGVAPKWCSRWRRGPAHVAFVFWELRPLEPMLPMRLFRSRPSAGITAILFHWAAGLGAILFMAQFLQAELGFGPFDAGLGLMPWGATAVVVPQLFGRQINCFGERPFIAGGLSLNAWG